MSMQNGMAFVLCMISLNGFYPTRVTGVALLLEVAAFENETRLKHRGDNTTRKCTDDEKAEALWCLLRGHVRIVDQTSRVQ
jgi:hypothetical protein